MKAGTEMKKVTITKINRFKTYKQECAKVSYPGLKGNDNYESLHTGFDPSREVSSLIYGRLGVKNNPNVNISN